MKRMTRAVASHGGPADGKRVPVAMLYSSTRATAAHIRQQD